MASAVRIVYEGTADDRVSGGGITPSPVFGVVRDGGRTSVEVALPMGLAQRLLGGSYRAVEQPDRDRLSAALLRFGVRRIERAISAGLPFVEQEPGVATITVQEEDLQELRDLLGDKTCEYQIEDGRELFCSAASRSDSTVTHQVGRRRLAPTSRRICLECDLPNTDVVCSHLVHPSVSAMGPVGSSWDRFVELAVCDQGRPEIEWGNGHQDCRAGGHGCCERIVETVEAPVQPVLSPLSLLDQIDFLATAWRLLFDERLLELETTAHVGGLALGCSNKEEFKARLSDLAALLERFRVPRQLLPADADVPRGALKQVEAVLQREADDPAAEASISQAVTTLRALVNVRHGYQHSDAEKRLPANFSTLGIPYPPTDWDRTWSQMRARAVDALAALRHEVQRIEAGRRADGPA